MRLLYTFIFAAAILILGSGCGSNYYLQSGLKDYNNLYYNKALQKFDKSLVLDSANYDANLMLAKTYMKMHDYKSAAEYYKLAVSYPQSTAEDKFNYAKTLMSLDRHDEADVIFTSYLKQKPDDPVAKSLKQSCQYISLLIGDSSKYEIEALPLQDNMSMFSPVRYKDGVVFTAERSANNNVNPWTGNSFYDIKYMSKSDSGWAMQKDLGEIFNSKYHDGPVAFSKDEKMAAFTRSYIGKDNKQRADVDNYNNLFIYTVEHNDSAWVDLKSMPFNSVDYTCMHPALSADGKMMIFASDMPDGKGGTDLYYTRLIDGEWTDPVNMGNKINTQGNETFPVLESDSVLYFSSDGLPSLGGLDIFRSSKSSGNWDNPKNMNYPINSVSDDFGYSYSKEDTLGYFASKRNGYDQIFQIKEIYKGIVTINGLVVDEVTGEPLNGALVKLVDKDTGEVIEELTVGSDGKFQLELESGKNYRIEAEKDGYLVQSHERSTVRQHLDETEDVTLRMRKAVITDPNTPYVPGSEGVFEIPNIFYDLDDYSIRPDAAYELEKVVVIMNDNPTMKIELNSHTDSRAQDGYNMRLSINRAKSAKAYLVGKGIDGSRISYKGFGETHLVNGCGNDVNCSEAQHQENRRTEFIITEY